MELQAVSGSSPGESRKGCYWSVFGDQIPRQSGPWSEDTGVEGGGGGLESGPCRPLGGLGLALGVDPPEETGWGTEPAPSVTAALSQSPLPSFANMVWAHPHALWPGLHRKTEVELDGDPGPPAPQTWHL